MSSSGAAPSDRSFMAYPSGSSSTTTSTSGMQPHAWEDQRKEARRLENALDVKLGQFAKLCSGYEQSYSRGEGGLATDQLMDSKAAELEKLLSQLSDVNDSMRNAMGGRQDTRTHTLTRHRDILHDYQQEFRRHTSSLGASRDRVQLLRGSSDRSPLLGGVNASGALLRERGQISGANAALDEVMGTANAVAGRVGEQSRIFENIGNKVLAVGAKFPAINGIINAVRRKKSKDTIILASVIAVCTVLLLIYWISKH